MGLACDWDLTGKDPVRLDWACAHRFRFDPWTGECVLEEPNIRLEGDGRLRLERDERSAAAGAVTAPSAHSPPESGPRGGRP